MLLQSLDLAQKRVRNHAASNISGILRQSGGGGGEPSMRMNVEDVEWSVETKSKFKKNASTLIENSLKSNSSLLYVCSESGDSKKEENNFSLKRFHSMLICWINKG